LAAMRWTWVVETVTSDNPSNLVTYFKLAGPWGGVSAAVELAYLELTWCLSHPVCRTDQSCNDYVKSLSEKLRCCKEPHHFTRRRQSTTSRALPPSLTIMSAPSLANAIVKRPWLQRLMTPLANWYCNVAGYRKLGLRYAHPLCSDRLTSIKAVGPLQINSKWTTALT